MARSPASAARSRSGPGISLALFLAAVASPACPAQNARKAGQGMANDNLLLTAAVDSISAGELVVSYKVENRRPGTVYVFNLLYETDRTGGRTPDAELAYTFADQAEFRVGKFLVKIPAGMKVESAEIPYLDALAPGKSLTGAVRVPLPARRFHPYYPIAGEGAVREAARVILSIGVVDRSRGGPREAVVEPARGAGEGRFNCDYGLGLKYQELLEAPLATPGFRYYTGAK
jgi:hypothetical protein